MAKTIAVTGGQLVYDEFGDGPETIVFVHGTGDNHLSWWQQVPAFREHYRCVVYEVWGWGRSRDDSGEGRSTFARVIEQPWTRSASPKRYWSGSQWASLRFCPSRCAISIASAVC